MSQNSGGLAGHGDLDKALGSVRYKPHMIRICAVRLELTEQSRSKRRMSQKEVAAIFDVSARVLRKWVKWYNDEGVEGLKARGGQGRKPDVPPEMVCSAIADALESGGTGMLHRGDGDGDGDGDGACPACAATRDRGKARPRPRPPPKPCGCRGRCENPRKCKCRQGRACECPCCRPLRLPPRGPRHAPDCPRAGITAKNATTMHEVRRRIYELSGKKYSTSYTYSLMAQHGLALKALACVHVRHADPSKVTRWQKSLPGRLDCLRKAGYVICASDEVHSVHNKATGRMFMTKGTQAALPHTGSSSRVSLFGYYFEDGTVTVHEYRHADAYSQIDSLERLVEDHDKIAIITDRSSIRKSRKGKRLLRKFRRMHPGKDVRFVYLPVGCPYLNVVEEIWNLLKSRVVKNHYYPTFDDLRWAIYEFFRTTRFKLDMKKYLYRDPKKYALAT